MTLFKAQEVRCCLCGVMTPPNDSNTCIQCLKSKIDIAEGIHTSTLVHCKECNRWKRPPWSLVEMESPQMLAYCMKNVRMSKAIEVVDAGFIWTEPHSKRLKVKASIRKEVLDKVVLQKDLVVEFEIRNEQCPDCKKTYTPHLWVGQVQVR